MKRWIALLLCFVITLTMLSGCSSSQDPKSSSTNKLNVVTTIFPYYDFVRQIGKDKVNLKMIVSAGKDSHTFEPTPADLINIQKSDIFFYNGGAMEYWVQKIQKSQDNSNQISYAFMDSVNPVKEEVTEGMSLPKEEEGEEYDEHIWTSPVNARKIVKKICAVLSEKDPDNARFYEENTKSYLKKLKALDQEFRETVKHGKRKIMVFGDKFPLRYFTDEYGLSYRAAFPGCSEESEPSSRTLSYLIELVKKEKIPVIYHMDFGSSKIADVICEASGAENLTFYSCHTVTKRQFDQGVTYLYLMKKNVKNLEKGLNK